MFDIYVPRTESSKFTSWYYGTDRKLLGFVLGLIFIGMLCTVSAGSVQALRKGWEWYYFLQKMFPFYVMGIGALFVASMLNKKWVIGIATANVVVCLLLLVWTVINPVASHGSERWAVIGGFSVMPSDILKPGLVVMTGYFLAKMHEKYGDNMFLAPDAWKPSWLSWYTYLVPFGIVLIILFLQPDVGTTMLYLATVGIMFFIAGLPRKIWLPLLGAGGLLGFFAFLFHSHVHQRVLDFFGPLDPRSQVGFSVNAIRQGGLLGMGDEAFAKEYLPDAHTDFIFAAVAEDWGAIIACGLLVFLLIVLRRLVVTAMSARDTFVFYTVGGAAALFGTQACINLATTLRLMPPKGMTLPFISSGGSSFLGYCLLFGMVLAIVREDKWKK